MNKKIPICLLTLCSFFIACGRSSSPLFGPTTGGPLFGPNGNGTSFEGIMPDTSSAGGTPTGTDFLSDSFQKALDNSGGKFNAEQVEQLQSTSDQVADLSDLILKVQAMRGAQAEGRVGALVAKLKDLRSQLGDASRKLKKFDALKNVADLLKEESKKVALFRFYNAKVRRHFFTTHAGEAGRVWQYGFHFEGIAASIYSSIVRPECNVKLYRCYVPASGNHFASHQASCEGQQTIGLFGFICGKSSDRASLPLYRAFNGEDHLLTVNKKELSHNFDPFPVQGIGAWRIEGIMGWVSF